LTTFWPTFLSWAVFHPNFLATLARRPAEPQLLPSVTAQIIAFLKSLFVELSERSYLDQKFSLPFLACTYWVLKVECIARKVFKMILKLSYLTLTTIDWMVLVNLRLPCPIIKALGARKTLVA